MNDFDSNVYGALRTSMKLTCAWQHSIFSGGVNKFLGPERGAKLKGG